MALRPRTRIKLVCSAWQGDTGRVEKYVPFDYYYVQLKRGGRQVVHARCVAPQTVRGRAHRRSEDSIYADIRGARRRRRR